ncbi:hypothetical protein RRM63_003764, partial [Photobacterium damselae]|nr:hypothetical protein [Photobacterium damselae]
MIKIDLKKIFSLISENRYCVIKNNIVSFDYEVGSDIDIFCYDIDSLSKNILFGLNEYLNDEKAQVTIKEMLNQRYIDFIYNGEINLRFDLYNKLPEYKNVLLKESFFSTVIETSKSKCIDGVKINVPNKKCEFILRYIEYHEWFSIRPDKIKHIDFILETYTQNEINKNLEDLHYYISFPSIKARKKS